MTTASETVNAQITTGAIASKLGAEIHGDESMVITAIKPLEVAGNHELSFVTVSKSGTEKLLAKAQKTEAGALLTPQFFNELAKVQIVTPNPMGAVVALASLFYRPPEVAQGVHPQAIVDDTAKLGENVSVGAFCVIGKNVQIGKNTIIHPHVVIYEGAAIGESCIVHSGAVVRERVEVGNDCVIQNGVVVGGDGFGYIPDKELGHRRIPHLGRTVLKDHVDLGANSTVDRATLGETVINRSTKIDNLVMVGHNNIIGERAILCAHVGISGSCNIGNDVILGGQAGVADHITIGDKVRAGAKAGIAGNIPAETDVAGYPAVEFPVWRRFNAVLKRLPELLKRIRELEKRVGIDT